MSTQKKLIDKAMNFLRNRVRDYAQTFGESNEHAQDVLRDLEKFCRANDTTFHLDPRKHALLEGRREVYLRIRDHLDLPIDKLFKKYNGG